MEDKPENNNINIQNEAPRILIVDDNPSNLSLIVSYLETQNFKCMVARTGKAGLERAKQADLDIILLDILMPEIDGFEICRRLKADKKTRMIPVIFMTALSAQKDKIEGFNAGGVDYITKPIDEKELLARISTHLSIRNMTLQMEKNNEDLVQLNRCLQKEIAQRKKTEEALRKVHKELELKAEDKIRKLSRAVEQSPASIVITDIKGTIEYVNPKFTQISGYDYTEVIGENPRILRSGEQETAFYKEMWDTIKSGKEWRGEFHNKKKSGELYWEHASISPIISEEGTITSFIAVKENITERKQAEKEIKERGKKFKEMSQQFHTLLDAIPDSLILLSPELDVTWANKNCVFGNNESKKDSLAHKCYMMWQNSSKPCEGCPTIKSFESGKAESSQLTLANGKTWAVRSFPITDETGLVTKVIELSTDITEKLKLNEETMRASQLASIGELAAGVAHEINNPINSIVNLTQLLADDESKGTSNYDVLERIISEGKRIAVIVRGLLSFSRKGEKGEVAVKIDNVLSDCLLLTEIQLKKDNIECKIDFPPSIPQITANYQQLQQVFLNIINNAHYSLNEKYPGCDENKLLKISAEEIVIPGNSFLRIIFYDQGVGIPSEIKDKLAEPFFSTKPRNEGTGLGLSISYGIIKNYGGQLSFDSIEGEFTKVIIDLPIRGREEG